MTKLFTFQHYSYINFSPKLKTFFQGKFKFFSQLTGTTLFIFPEGFVLNLMTWWLESDDRNSLIADDIEYQLTAGTKNHKLTHRRKVLQRSVHDGVFRENPSLA